MKCRKWNIVSCARCVRGISQSTFILGLILATTILLPPAVFVWTTPLQLRFASQFRRAPADSENQVESRNGNTLSDLHRGNGVDEAPVEIKHHDSIIADQPAVAESRILTTTRTNAHSSSQSKTDHEEPLQGTSPATSDATHVSTSSKNVNKVDPRYIPIISKPAPHTDTLTILFWSGTEADVTNSLMASECPVDGYNVSCTYTDDKKLYNHSEAVLISLIHLSFRVVSDVPAYRFPFQKWIYTESEAPPEVWMKERWKNPDRYTRLGHLFNMTALFVPNADVQTHEMASKCDISQLKLDELRRSNTNYAQNKTKKIAWFVSHCVTQSKREEYVAELQKFVDVDVLGACGNKSCGDRYHPLSCDSEILAKDYKFYLSFENSICEGYVTEKLQRLIALPISTIPIVLGASDYNKDYPPGTLINVMDYHSPKSLATYINTIDKNDTMFNEYIMRRKSLKCHRDLTIPYPCRLCKFLHEHRNDKMTAPDVTKFWGVEKRCKKPQDVLPGVNFSSLEYTFPTTLT